MKKKNLRDIFIKLKFKEDFLIIHSDLLSFYNFEFDIDYFFQELYECLGYEKTLIFPTFNIKKIGVWKLNFTKGESGSLSEFVRTKHGCLRSLHPVHSVSIFGPRKKEIPINKCLSSFGKNSCWEWLCENKSVRNISLGIGFVGGSTICHYPEEKIQVNYRCYSRLKTKVYNHKNKQLNKQFLFFGRKKGVVNDWTQCEKDLKKSGILVYHNNRFGIPVLSMNTKKATNYIVNKISKNMEYLIKK